MLTGDHFTVIVNPFDRVEYLKNMIQRKKGIPMYLQTLFYQENQLEDGKQLAYYSFNKNSEIVLIIIKEINITVITPTIKHEKYIINPQDFVINLKSRIQDREGIPPDQQILIYNGHNLEEEKTLADYLIGENSIIFMKIILARSPNNDYKSIFVKSPTGKHLGIKVNPQIYIKDLKLDLYRKTECLPCQQRLLHLGRQLDDSKTLAEYQIDENSTIHMILSLRGDKPVIYLYPERDNFEVNINIDMKKEDGEITSKYPVINDENNTWKVIANKDGEITYKGRKHYYLFWECIFNQSFDMNDGFVIDGKDCYNFFEEKLQYLGLNEKEANDFITYWCPRMEHSKYVHIKFQDEEYSRRVPLTASPKPDTMKRIFMTFKLLEEKISVPIQNLDKYRIVERKGFFILEWGGSQVH